MKYLPLMGEFFALLILAIVFIRYYGYEWHVVFTAKRKAYLYCLTAAAASIVLNILSVVCTPVRGVPLWLAITLNSGYFLTVTSACSLFALFLFQLTLEHVYEAHCLKRAKTAVAGLTAACFLLIFLNLFTGVLFRFDDAGHYCRGPLNRLVFLLPLAELVLLGICYCRNRSSVSSSVTNVIRSLPPIVLFFTLLQIFVRNCISTACSAPPWAWSCSSASRHTPVTGTASPASAAATTSSPSCPSASRAASPSRSSWCPSCPSPT